MADMKPHLEAAGMVRRLGDLFNSIERHCDAILDQRQPDPDDARQLVYLVAGLAFLGNMNAESVADGIEALMPSNITPLTSGGAK